MKPRGGEGQKGQLNCPLGFLVHYVLNCENKRQIIGSVKTFDKSKFSAAKYFGL